MKFGQGSPHFVEGRDLEIVMHEQIAKEIALQPSDRRYRTMFRSTESGGQAQNFPRPKDVRIVAGAKKLSRGIKTQNRHRAICKAKLSSPP